MARIFRLLLTITFLFVQPLGAAAAQTAPAQPPSQHETITPQLRPPLPSVGPQQPVTVPGMASGMASSMGAASTSEAIVNHRLDPVDVRVLVITADGEETDFAYITDYLQRLGIPFTTLVAASQPFSASTPVGQHPSRLLLWHHPDQRQSLLRYRWRELPERLHSRPMAGLVGVRGHVRHPAGDLLHHAVCGARSGIVWADHVDPRVGHEQPGDGHAHHGRKRCVPVSFAHGVEIFNFTDTWTYLSKPISTTTTVPLLTTADGYTLAAIHTYADGRQNLAVTSANNEYFRHSILLSYGLVNWVTTGHSSASGTSTWPPRLTMSSFQMTSGTQRR